MTDIVVVEDSANERTFLERVAREAGYAVKSFDSTAAAEEHIRSNGARLVVLDVGLKDRSGTILMDRLLAQMPSVNIVIFTGNSSPTLRARCLEAGVLCFILKGSAEARPDAFSQLFKEVLGEPTAVDTDGIPLSEFVERCLHPSSRPLFQSQDGAVPVCDKCGATELIVSFAELLQVPPSVTGLVKCRRCGAVFDPAI